MRITIVQGPFLPVPPLRGGAIEKIMSGLGGAWAAAGHEVVHLSRRFPGLPDAGEIDGVRHLRLPSRDAPRDRLRFRLAELAWCRRVLAALPPADIVVSNSPLLPLLKVPAEAGLLCPYVGRLPKAQVRLYRGVACLLAMSEAVAEALAVRAPHLARRIAVVGGPLPAGWRPLDLETAAAPRPPVALYVGRLHPEKGLDLLIEGFARWQAGESSAGRDMPDGPWTLRLVGPHEEAAGGGGRAYLERLRAHAAARGLAVDFAGPIYDGAALAEACRQARLFVYPSLAEKGEALGMAPIEAMAMGCLPVVSDLACFRDFLDGDRAGIRFDHRAADPAGALAQALARAAAADPDVWRPRVLEAADRFTLEAVAVRHLKVFAAALAAGDSVPAAFRAA